ncbi:MAG: hypothetical protein II477_08565 [Lachnospiraceae bacterium]|nr:hypothetical protein [Lachnospiraceae bacterium]
MITAAAVVCCVLFMFFFMAVESGHDCAGEDCEICYCLEACESVFGSLKLFDAFFIVLGIICASLIGVIAYADPSLGHTTPILQKVRLNN